MLRYRRALAGELSEFLLAAEQGDRKAAEDLTRSKRNVHGQLEEVAAGEGFRASGAVG
jgi:hypothetical protein